MQTLAHRLTDRLYSYCLHITIFVQILLHWWHKTNNLKMHRLTEHLQLTRLFRWLHEAHLKHLLSVLKSPRQSLTHNHAKIVAWPDYLSKLEKNDSQHKFWQLKV